MARRTEYFAYLITLIALAAAGPAAAGSFSISPIRADLSARQRTEALTVRNESADQQVVVQASVVAWSQADGQDVLTDTRDVIVTPPVFTMAPNAQQIVRVAVRRQADPKRELTYRLILQEVPPEASRNFTGLQVALRLSLPVFVAPLESSAPDLRWSAAWRSDGSLEVSAQNAGNINSQIVDFTIEPKQLPKGVASAALKNSVVKYVLPGSTMSWRLPPPADAPALAALKQGPLTLRGLSDRGEFSVDLSTDGR